MDGTIDKCISPSDHSKQQKGQPFNQIERHECTFGAYLEVCMQSSVDDAS